MAGRNLKKRIQKLFSAFPSHAFESVELLEVKPTEVLLEVKDIEASRTTAYGTLHGGYVGVYADSAMWLSVMTDLDLKDKKVRTREINKIRFFETVSAGDSLLVSGKHINTSKGKKTIYFAFAEVRSMAGDLVAIAEGEYQVVDK